MQCFHWNRHCNRPYDPRVGCESRRVIEKRRETDESVLKSPTGWYSYRQDVMTFPTRCRVRDVYCTVSRRSMTTSRKPLTDKPDHKQTSHKDKQTGLEKHTEPHDQTWSRYCNNSFWWVLLICSPFPAWCEFKNYVKRMTKKQSSDHNFKIKEIEKAHMYAVNNWETWTSVLFGDLIIKFSSYFTRAI